MTFKKPSNSEFYHCFHIMLCLRPWYEFYNTEQYINIPEIANKGHPVNYGRIKLILNKIEIASFVSAEHWHFFAVHTNLIWWKIYWFGRIGLRRFSNKFE